MEMPHKNWLKLTGDKSGHEVHKMVKTPTRWLPAVSWNFYFLYLLSTNTKCTINFLYFPDNPIISDGGRGVSHSHLPQCSH